MKAKYLGLDLSSPVVVSSSPYTATVANIGQCVANGVEGLLDRLSIFPRKGDWFFEITVLFRTCNRDRLFFVAVRRGSNIDDIDRRISQKLFHGVVYLAMTLRIDPCLRLFCGSVPNPC